MKKLFIKTYGCQMNVYDSARMADLLAPLGYAPTDGAEDADMVILNTCHIREKAAEKIYSELGRLKRLKDRKAEDGAPMLIAVAGCVAQAEGKEILARQQAVDLVVGPQSYHRLPEMIARAARERGPCAGDGFSRRREIRCAAGRARERRSQPPSSPCRKVATSSAPSASCLIRAAANIRGPSSRSWREARASRGARRARDHAAGPERQRLSRRGLRTARAGRWRGFCIVLAEIEGLARLRYTTSHPRDMGDDLIAAHGDIDRADALSASAGAVGLGPRAGGHEPPAQARRLSRAGRSHPRRAARSSRCRRISSSAFPAKRDADFEATLSLVRDVGFAQRLLVQIQRAARHAGGRAGEAGARRREDRAAARRCRRCCSRSRHAFNASCAEARHAGAVRKAGPQAGQAVGRSPICSPCMWKARAI